MNRRVSELEEITHCLQLSLPSSLPQNGEEP